MTFPNLFALLYRRWMVIVAFTFLMVGGVLGSVYFFGLMRGSQVTVFITIGAENSVSGQSPSTLYDTVQAADFFTETVQGWFKNPEFLRKIEAFTNEPLNFSVRKQEKQNLVATITTTKSWDMKGLRVTLEQFIDEYNTASKVSFRMTHFSYGVSSQRSPLGLLGLLGVVTGILFGIAISWFYEYLFGYVSDSESVKAILGREPLDQVFFMRGSKKLHFVAYYLHTVRQKNIVVIGLFKGAECFEQNLKDLLKDKNVMMLQFPEAIDKLSTLRDAHLVIPVRLGKTTIADLKKLKLVLPQDFSFLILQ